MDVLLTGGNGFVGSHAARALLNRGCRVVLLVRQESGLSRIAGLSSKADVEVCDVFDENPFDTVLGGARFDAVCHMAWWGVGGRHRNDPRQLSVNLNGSLRFLENCLEAGCGRFVGLGSQAEYGPKDSKLDESTPTDPTTLYGGAKLSFWHLGRVLAEQKGVPFVWLRLFSTYGPLDDPSWLIPSTIISMLRGERPQFTKAAQKWDYLFVEDLAEAVAEAATNPNANGVYNLGSGTAVPVRDIVEGLRDRIDPGMELVFGEIPYRPDQVMHLEADIGKFSADTGWRPATTLETGLDKTANWFRENHV